MAANSDAPAWKSLKVVWRENNWGMLDKDNRSNLMRVHLPLIFNTTYSLSPYQSRLEGFIWANPAGFESFNILIIPPLMADIINNENGTVP